MNSRRVATTPYAVAHRAVLRADVRQNARQCAPGDAARTPQRDSLQVFPRRLRLQLGLRLRRRLGMSLQVSACKGGKTLGIFFLENIQGQNFSRRGGAGAIARTPEQLVWRGATRMASDA